MRKLRRKNERASMQTEENVINFEKWFEVLLFQRFFADKKLKMNKEMVKRRSRNESSEGDHSSEKGFFIEERV